MVYQETIASGLYSDLVGIPFKRGGRWDNKLSGIDCYGLVMEIYKRIGIELPEYLTVVSRVEIDCSINKAKHLFKKLDGPERFSIVTIKMRPPYVSHVGVVLNYPYFIHVLEKSNVVVERLDSPEWERRVEGYYRWKN